MNQLALISASHAPPLVSAVGERAPPIASSNSSPRRSRIRTRAAPGGVGYPALGKPMALIDCPSCGHKVSSEAKVCPSCGHPITPKSRWFGIGCFVIPAIIILSFILASIVRR